jgi:hypothetical protein
MATRLDRRISRIVRAAVGLRGSACPIKIQDGFGAPIRTGQGGHWTTPGGRPVYYPNAYRRAWGKPVYHCSTLGIAVGAGWIIEQLNAEDARQAVALSIAS